MKASSLARFHLLVFIWGFTAVLGKLISLPALELVWYRVIFTMLSLLIYFRLGKHRIRLPWRSALMITGIGVIVGAHWYFFYHAIKVSNISITLISLSTITLFTSFLEPLFFKRKISLLEVMMGLLVIAGICLIFNFEKGYGLGIFYGILAAFGGSLFVVFNGKIAAKHHAYSITFYEMLGAGLLLSLMKLWDGSMSLTLIPDTSDLFYLLLLSVICTAYPFVESVRLMKDLSPFTVNMITNLEPVYGILLSLMVFGDKEYMSSGFYYGTALIMIAIFSYIFLKKRNRI